MSKLSVTKNAKKYHNIEEINLEKLAETISEEFAAVLKSKEAQEILKAVVQSEALSEKEEQLLKLKTVLMESVSTLLLAETGYRGSRFLCSCGTQAKFVRYDEKGINLLFGKVVLKRALYHCQGCDSYIRPLDDLWELPSGRNSEGVERVSSLLGTFMPFETAEEVLWETSGVSLSDNTIRTVSENIGSEMEQVIQTEIENSQRHELPEPQAEVLAVLTDGTMVNTRDEQWKEVKVGAIASYSRKNEKELELEHASYTSFLGDVEGFRPRLWSEAYRRGTQGREATLFLGDGSHWIWNLADELFPGAMQVLDYWHLCENVWKTAHEFFIDEEEKRDWVEDITGKLRRGEVEKALRAVESLPEGGSKEAILGCINNNKGRMNYPELEEKSRPLLITTSCLVSNPVVTARTTAVPCLGRPPSVFQIKTR